MLCDRNRPAITFLLWVAGFDLTPQPHLCPNPRACRGARDECRAETTLVWNPLNLIGVVPA